MDAKEYNELVRLQSEGNIILARRIEIAREIYSVWNQKAFEKAFGTCHSNELQKFYDTLAIPYNNLKPAEFGTEIIHINTFEKHDSGTNYRLIFIPACAMVMSEKEWIDHLNEMCETQYNKFIETIEDENENVQV